MLAERLRDWLIHEMGVDATSCPPPAQLLSPLLSSPALSSLYLFLVTRVRDPSRPSSEAIAVAREEERRYELDGRLRDAHRAYKSLEREEAEKRTKCLLLDAYVSKVQRRLEAQRSWTVRLQRLSAAAAGGDEGAEYASAEQENQDPQQPLISSPSAAPIKRTQRLQAREHVRDAQRRLCEVRAAIAGCPLPSSPAPTALAPLLASVRQQHLAMAVRTQQVLTTTAQVELRTAALPLPPPSLSASLQRVRRSVAATAAVLREWEAIKKEGGGGIEARAQVEAERARVQAAEDALAQERAQCDALRSQRLTKRARWPDHVEELRQQHSAVLEPTICALREELQDSRGQALDEWERVRHVPFEATYTTTTATAAPGVSSIATELPWLASSLYSVQAPWSGLAQLLDGLDGGWHRSADRLLPELCQEHVQHARTTSTVRVQQARMEQLLASSTALSRMPALLEASAGLASTHASLSSTLSALAASSTSLSVQVSSVRQTLQLLRSSPMLDMLRWLTVDNRTPRQWMDALSALEERSRQAQETPLATQSSMER